eukprot:CAMPEP_0194305452 /NCGR_PEP_ID=MMETSP0171-20130528/2886_1 /TAXON_ID=218684 /ORGANISM="Corethron pennatum, Strain L29A3" /LENGTH=910 /DNA_ID=CAMNT_0039056993 /DNA_START=47 /DNA_END=2779 /DNA_ORIENTATION=+
MKTKYGALSTDEENVEVEKMITDEDCGDENKVDNKFEKLTINCDKKNDKRPLRSSLRPTSPEKPPRHISPRERDPLVRRGRSPRAMFDKWLRRDYSVSPANSIFSNSSFSPSNGGWGISPRSNTPGGGAAVTAAAETFMGPNERSVEKMVRFTGGHGLDYKSVDREQIDTAVWQQRKVELIKLKSQERESDKRYEYKYDHAAIAALETEAWRIDRVLVVGIGFFMALTGVAISRTADSFLEMKIDAALDRLELNGFTSGMAFHVGVSALFALGAFLPVGFRPVAAGSGIAEAKAILNGVVITGCTAVDAAICKGISVIMSVAASLPAGLEGPMIFLGLAIGENANRLVPQKKLSVLDTLKTERSRIDYAAIGTAAGVAAAFRSPLSGVLFAMEEGSSFWSTDLTWRCFLSACICVITMYGVMQYTTVGEFHVTSMALFNGIDEGELKDNHAQIPDGYDVPHFAFWEYAVIALVGSLGGLIGGAFCHLNRELAMVRRRLSLGLAMKGVEVVAITATAAALIWFVPSIPFFSTCKHIGDRQMEETFYRQFDCPEGDYNEIATLLLNPLGGKSITLLFQSDPGAFSVKSCIAAGLLHLVILCVCFGMAVSAGIFIPLLFIGACFGRAFALVVGLDPRTYAIVGAAATLGGVARVLISLTAIVAHTSSLSFFITPVMVSTLMAKFFGDWATGRPGIYDNILQLRGVPFLEEECPAGARHANIRARNVMNPTVSTITTQINVDKLVKILQLNNCSDFPVVDKFDKVLVGKISRDKLLTLLSCKKLFFADSEEGGKGNGLALSSSEMDMARVERQDEEDIFSNISVEDAARCIHVAPYLQIAPHTFDGHGSAERAYEMFRCLGLRSLLVVDKRFRPIGIITRHELALLEEIGEHEHMVEKKKSLKRIYSEQSLMFE